VVNASWNDIQQYLRWLSIKTGMPYRLLTEAEWEYSARAGSTTRYPWGDEIGKGNANCNGCGSQWDNEQTAPVGSCKPNAFGLYDMHGNVWQFVEDCAHDNYEGGPADGSAWTVNCDAEGPRGLLRSLRGGSYRDVPYYLRSALRARYYPATGSPTTVSVSGGR
jgi:formylglycine-generating enzyme required for sulfatase activity